LFQNDNVLLSLVVAGSVAEAHVVSADDGAKVSVDVSSDSSCQNELTVTSESAVVRPTSSDPECSSVLSAKPAELSAVGAAKTGDAATEPGASELSSQESSVTRTRSRDVMDFEHLRKKLVELTGPNKEATGGHGKVKAAEVEEVKDVLPVDSVGVVASVTPNSASQVTVGRAVTTGQQVLGLSQAVDGHRGPSTTPEPLAGPVQASSQQASLTELPVTTVVPRDTTVQQVSVTTAQVKLLPSDDEHLAAPVQPVKPVPVYPVTMAQPLTQQKLMSAPLGQVNGSTVAPQMAAGMLAADVQAAMLQQQQQQHHYHLASAVPAAVDNTGGFVPVVPGMVGVGDASCPASPDSISQVTAPQQPQPAAVDYSQASLLALYNQMMMPLPFVAPAWPALGVNPFLMAANPLLAAQMMYGAPVMPSVSEPLGQMPALDPQLGGQGYAMAGQAHQQHPVVPGLGHPQVDQAVRATVGLLPGTPLHSSVTTVGAAARLVAPRPPVTMSGHEPHAAGQAVGVQRKRSDRPPYLASLEQALIEKLHGPRKPVAAMIPGHSPAGPTMAWFPVPYGAHTQHDIHTPTAVQSPVVSPLFNADLQPPAAAADMASSASLPPMSLTTTFTYSGRTTPSVATAAEHVTGKSAAAASLPAAQNVTVESHEVSTAVDVDKAGQLASKHNLQLSVKDDASHVHESTAVCEVSNDSLSQQDTTAATQAGAAVTSANKATVKKGRFRISDVKEALDVTASNSQFQLETGSQQSPEAELNGSGARNDLSGNSEMTGSLLAAELTVQQVRSTTPSAWHSQYQFVFVC